MNAGVKKTHVHFIGIGGSGLSAIARMMKDSGYHVTGSDRTLSPFAEDLRAAGVKVYTGHAASNIAGADWIVRSSAVPDDNIEVRAAQAAGIPVYRRADFLGKFMENKIGIAVAGTHGKTTTTAMIAYALSRMNLNPSFIVGGVLNDLGVNAGAGSGEYFVVEADEYDRMFLGLRPRLEVVTSIEHDHPDCYPTYDDMFSAFESFTRLLPADGSLVASADNKGSASLAREAAREGHAVLAYGTGSGVDLPADRWMHAEEVTSNEHGGFNFRATTNVGAVSEAVLELRVPGRHNVSNALAALGAMALVGLSISEAASALADFTGTGRRFEIKGEKKGIVIVDDYAHHPTEIKATLAAARSRFPNHRIWAVWQPHTYSRTRALFDGFLEAFGDADEAIITEIYAAREPEQDFSSRRIVEAMSRENVHFIASLEEASSYLLDHLQAGDVLIVLSAGDADRIGREVLAGLEE
jgi:UDP-N-acetylmuramate--alanine ligase